jgi:hypothetical protein
MLLGAILPWLMFWLCRHLGEGRIGAGEAVIFIAALIGTLAALILKWNLHNSQTWNSR